MDKWDHRFMDLATLVSSWSRDPFSKVGAVLVKDKRVISLGYNGFPEGIEDSEDRLSDRELKNKLTIHAEVNAILNANSSVRYATLYSTLFPCHNCAKILIQAGIINVISPKPSDEHWDKYDMQMSYDLFDEYGSLVSWYEKD